MYVIPLLPLMLERLENFISHSCNSLATGSMLTCWIDMHISQVTKACPIFAGVGFMCSFLIFIHGIIFLFCCHGSRYSFTKAFCIAFVMTFFSMFDVPVFWPILLCYWIVLFVLTMRRQIAHMIKYKYIPFNTGKQVRFAWF